MDKGVLGRADEPFERRICQKIGEMILKRVEKFLDDLVGSALGDNVDRKIGNSPAAPNRVEGGRGQTPEIPAPYVLEIADTAEIVHVDDENEHVHRDIMVDVWLGDHVGGNRKAERKGE
jgi:hypothetical protein